MTILLYGENDTLLEAQLTSNSSNIGGYDFYLPHVWVENGKDEEQNQIVDINFIVQTDVRQGFSTDLSEGEYYT